jgi:predicted outer membrane repeat protein
MHVQLDSTLGITNTTVEYNNATGQGGSLYGNGGEKVANFRHCKKELLPNMC